jgi:hypothetical protein
MAKAYETKDSTGIELLTPPHQEQLKSAQVYYNDFHTDKRKSKFNITQDDWDIIRRDNNPDKTLSEKPKKLLGKVYKLIEQNKDGKAWFSYETLKVTLDCKKRQVINILNEITHIVSYKWRKGVKIGGSRKDKVVVFEYTKNGRDILARPHIYYGNNCYTNVKACNLLRTSNKDEKNILKTRSSVQAHEGANISQISKINNPSSETQNSVEIEKAVSVVENIALPTETAEVRKLRNAPPENKCKKPTNAEKQAKLYKFQQYSQPRTLKEMEAITPTECFHVQLRSGREFNLNAQNELLKDMARKLHKTFHSRAQFLGYFSKCMYFEKRQACQINNENFRITARASEAEVVEHATLQKRDNYFSEVETRAYTHRTDENQYRAKLVGTMKPWQAYNFLSNLKTVRKVGDTLELYIAKQVELTAYSLETVLQEANAVGGYCGVEKLEFVVR